MTDTKNCPKCGETKSVARFHRNRAKSDGLSSYCKECETVRHRAYDSAHRDEIASQKREYREAHREERRAYARAYWESHKEEVRERQRAYARDRYALLGNPTSERWREITAKHATRAGEPWSEAEDAYLATSTDRIGDDALALKRTYKSVAKRLTDLRRRGVTLARDRALAA